MLNKMISKLLSAEFESIRYQVINGGTVNNFIGTRGQDIVFKVCL